MTPGQPGRGAKILVIDDDPVVCELVESVLAGWDHTVLAAADAAAGLRLLFAERPDLVILDVNLPDLDGWALLERIRELPSPNDLRAIGETLQLIERQRRPLVFVVNNAGAGRLTGQAAVALSQHGTVAPVTLRTRQDFRSSMIDGRTAGELDPKGKSAAEVAQLWRYLADRLDKEVRYGTTVAA